MSEMPSSGGTYAFGHDAEAVQRLLTQSHLLNPFTRHLLEEAGITKGMKVLDVGCGPGDVSLLAAELVGEEGLVIGIDTNSTALQVAQTRAQAVSFGQVSFLTGDIRDLALEQEFDAVVGRLILQHVREPASLLHLLAQRLRPGGLVAFQEYNLTVPRDRTFPHCPLWEQASTWCYQATQRAGVEYRMGMKLYSTFLSAGLPAPQLRYEAAIVTGSEWAGYEHVSNTVRVLMPLILQFEIASAAEIGIETLTERLREEIVSRGAVARLPSIVSAWVHTGKS